MELEKDRPIAVIYVIGMSPLVEGAHQGRNPSCMATRELFTCSCNLKLHSSVSDVGLYDVFSPSWYSADCFELSIDRSGVRNSYNSTIGIRENGHLEFKLLLQSPI